SAILTLFSDSIPSPAGDPPTLEREMLACSPVFGVLLPRERPQDSRTAAWVASCGLRLPARRQRGTAVQHRATPCNTKHQAGPPLEWSSRTTAEVVIASPGWEAAWPCEPR